MIQEYDQTKEVHGEELFTPPYLALVLKRKAAILMERISLLARVSQHCDEPELKGKGLFHLGRNRIVLIKMVFYVRKSMDPVLQVTTPRTFCRTGRTPTMHPVTAQKKNTVTVTKRISEMFAM